MRRRKIFYAFVGGGLFTVILMLLLLGGAPTTLAQPAIQSASTLVPPALTPQPAGAPASDPNAAAQEPAGNAPSEVESPQASTRYLHISGSVFVPLYSSTTFAYDSSGCMHITGGGNAFLQFPLQLPDQSTLTQLRLYFKDTNPSYNGTLWLAKYDDGIGYTYIVTTTTSGNGGWGTTTVNTNIVPDYVNFSYTLVWAPVVSDNTMQLCGFRVAYTPPPIFGMALPLIQK